MSSGGTAVPGPEGMPSLPNLQIVGQYIKDLSFENPGAPAGLTQQPQIEFGVDLQAKRGDEFHFEVELKLRVHAKNGGQASCSCWNWPMPALFRLHQYSRRRHAADPADPGAAHAVPLRPPHRRRCGARWRHAAFDDRADRFRGAVSRPRWARRQRQPHHAATPKLLRLQIALSPSSLATKAMWRAISSAVMRGGSVCGPLARAARFPRRFRSTAISTGASASPRCRPPTSSR